MSRDSVRSSNFSMRPIAMPSCWCFRPWTRRERTARSGTSCPASIRKAARCSASSIPALMKLQHDFLWRTTGISRSADGSAIFNRSCYEEVLIVRVHRDILAQRRTCRHATPRQGALARPLMFDPESRKASPRQWDPHHQILASSLKGGTAKAFPRPHRRTGKEPEIQLSRYRRAKVLEALYGGLRGMPGCDEHSEFAMVGRAR